MPRARSRPSLVACAEIDTVKRILQADLLQQAVDKRLNVIAI
jgi:hypothetical protein